MARGRLRVYVGAGPGVGKTYSMLSEAQRRQDRGACVVVAGVDAHDRPRTEGLKAGLRHVLDDGDVSAIHALHPDVVCVDDLARHQDLAMAVLDAGVDVVSTINIGELTSLADVAEQLSGVTPVAVVSDSIVRDADQVELVDIDPEALRRRVAHGNVIPANLDAFEPDVLAGLRELALRWVTEWAHGRGAPTPNPSLTEVVVVAITGAPANAHLVRRAARIAQRSQAGLFGVHVRTSRETAEPHDLGGLRDLLLAVGGEYHEVMGDDPSGALIEFANEVSATQLVMGEATGSVWQQLRDGSVVSDVLRRAGAMDVHVVGQTTGTTRSVGRSRSASILPASTLPAGLARRSPLSRRRRLSGYLLAVTGVPVVTIVDIAATKVDPLDSSAPVLFLGLVTAVAIVGGRRPALLAAAAGMLSTTYYFTPPRYTFSFATRGDLIDVVVFMLVALAVGTIVSRLAEREELARQSRHDAELVARVAGGVPSDRDSFVSLLTDIRIGFGVEAIAVLIDTGDGRWSTVAADGEPVPDTPADGLAIPLDANAVLVATGGALAPDRRRLLFAVAQQMAGSLERQRLADEAAQVTVAAETDRLRTSILRAVSHDFRTPLASIKAAASSLLQADVDWPTATRERFAHTINDKADHLDRMVANLLDLSRLDAGGVERHLQPVGIEDILPHALAGLDAALAERVDVDVADDLPRLTADPALLERALANVVNNALLHTPPDTPVRIEAAVTRERVLMRVIDHGPGIPPERRDDVLLPFHRLDDGGQGAGLGLAVAKGFIDVMGGDLRLDDTPGGGLTVTIALREAHA